MLQFDYETNESKRINDNHGKYDFKEEYVGYNGKTVSKNEYKEILGAHTKIESLIRGFDENCVRYFMEVHKDENNFVFPQDLTFSEKILYKKMKKTYEDLEEIYKEVEGYLMVYGLISFLRQNGISKEIVEKIEKNILKNNPIINFKKFIHNSKYHNFPSNFETGNNDYMYGVWNLEDLILGEGYKNSDYDSIVHFCDSLEKSKYFVRPIVSAETLNSSINIEMTAYGQKLKKYENIDIFLKENDNLEEKIRIELSDVLNDYNIIMKHVKELLVLKKVINVPEFTSIEVFDPSIRKRIEKICISLEKEINKLSNDLEKKYDKISSKLNDKSKVDLAFSSPQNQNDEAKERLEKLYQEMIEAKKKIEYIESAYEEYVQKSFHPEQCMSQNQFKDWQNDIIYNCLKEMRLILIKHPEMNIEKYKINLDDILKTVENNYETEDKEVQDAFKYKVYKEYVLYCSKEKNKNKIMTFQEFSKQKYNLELEVPKEFEFDYEEPKNKKR